MVATASACQARGLALGISPWGTLGGALSMSRDTEEHGTTAEGTNALLEAVWETACTSPDSPAFRTSDAAPVSYSELWQLACVVASELSGRAPKHVPVLVLGPKSALTVASFLSCLTSGHAYVPVDAELPARRVSDIAGQIEGATMLVTCDVPEALACCTPPVAAGVAKLVLAARGMLRGRRDSR